MKTPDVYRALKRFTVAQLQAKCAARDLPIHGYKMDLIRRIARDDLEQSAGMEGTEGSDAATATADTAQPTASERQKRRKRSRASDASDGASLEEGENQPPAGVASAMRKRIREEVMAELRAELVGEYEALEAQKARLVKEELKCKSGIVKLNVGGRVFTTLKSTLRSKGGYLKWLVDGECERAVDDKGMIFVDRDPDAFALILGWLRDPMSPRALPKTERFLHELQFYGLQDHICSTAGPGESADDSSEDEESGTAPKGKGKATAKQAAGGLSCATA